MVRRKWSPFWANTSLKGTQLLMWPGKKTLVFTESVLNWHFLMEQVFKIWGHSHLSLLSPQVYLKTSSNIGIKSTKPKTPKAPAWNFFPLSNPCPKSFNSVLPSSSFVVCMIMLMPTAGYDFTVPLCKWVKWCLNYIWLDERGLW